MHDRSNYLRRATDYQYNKDIRDFGDIRVLRLFLTAAIGPGVCLLWQNIVNSWQIWRHGAKSING